MIKVSKSSEYIKDFEIKKHIFKPLKKTLFLLQKKLKTYTYI